MTVGVALRSVKEYAGRPNWDRIFKELKGKLPGEHVGVFLCGAQAIAKQLRTNTRKHSDPLVTNIAKPTHFTFFAENF